MQTVELGPVRLHVLVVQPGLPGEADRVARELARLDPGTLLADLDTDSALRVAEAMGDSRRRFEPAFVDALLHDATRARFAVGVGREDHPLLAAARAARLHRADFVALRPSGKRPGFFARRAARQAAREVPATDADGLVRGLAARLTQQGVFDPVADVRAMTPRLESALHGGRAPLVAVVQAHRADAFLRAVHAMPRRSIA